MLECWLAFVIQSHLLCGVFMSDDSSRPKKFFVRVSIPDGDQPVTSTWRFPLDSEELLALKVFSERHGVPVPMFVDKILRLPDRGVANWVRGGPWLDNQERTLSEWCKRLATIDTPYHEYIRKLEETWRWEEIKDR